MEQAQVGAVVGASIHVLLQNLLNISREQINLFWYCKKDLEKLKKSFSMVEDFLHDAETRQVTDKAVKRWLWEIEALAFDADNVFDDINYQLLSNKVETTKNKTAIQKVLPFLSISNNRIAYRLTLSLRIKDIIERLEYVNQLASEFGLQTRIAIAQAPASGPNASGSTETGSIFVGRKNDVLRIVDMLNTIQSPAEQVLSVLPVVGMGGLGKTMLAREVFNDGKIKTRFDTRVWVHVPRVFDVLVVLKKILTTLTSETNILTSSNAEQWNIKFILKMLQTHLGAKKYLLVLDDVWNEDREKWDDFVKSFSGISSATRNCMIVTTRSQKVASIVGTLPVHNLRSLSDGDCWSLIKVQAFRGGDSPLEFETIGRNIANRCKGLPLAAKVFGGLLFGKSKNEWLEIEKKTLSNFGDGDHIYKILKLSFDNLSSPSLKKCFAYCSIFPKGYDIQKEKLIELWMAEGFLQTDGRNNINMETVGSNFLNILVHNSLLQAARRDEYDNVTHCNMHDLVHDLSYSILHKNDKDTDGVCQSRYIGWKPSGDGLLSIPEGQEGYVRTLFLGGDISDINFSDFESLRSLTLMGRDIYELPTSITELKHLRYLDISETGIRHLPDSIGELYLMQTLRANEKLEMGGFEKLPDSFSNLISLRHLHFHSFREILEVGKLPSLQTLPCFHVENEKGCGISELGNLKDLRGKLKICELEKVRDKYEAISANLSRKTNIYELSFSWGFRGEVDEEANDDESVLEGLQPHPNLKKLEIDGFRGKSLPLWTKKMAVQLDGRCCSWEGLDNLMEIRLFVCSAVEQLPALGHLPHLKSLYLNCLKNVRYIGSSFYNIKDCSKSRTSSSNNNINGPCESSDSVVVFGALERLELIDMTNLIKWAEVDCPLPNELDVFPKLEYLFVKRCKQLMSAPSHFPRLKELYIDDVERSLPLENICGMKLTSLTRVIIKGIQRLECLPDGLFSNNHNALEEFRILECRNLKSIPYPPPSSGGQQQGLTSLRKLEIKYCTRLTNLPVEMLVSCGASLEELRLKGLTTVTNLGMVIGCLHGMPNLRVLVIKKVPKFSIDNCAGSLNTNNRLEVLGMSPSLSWDDNVSFNEAVDAILLLPQFISLRTLKLSGKEHWECLPDQLQHLNALERLSLSRYGIEALPKWVENLSSLKRLELYRCKKLRHLPSKQAMLRLSKLTTLGIWSCPLLLTEERRNKDSQIVDSEWPKISHIPHIHLKRINAYHEILRISYHEMYMTRRTYLLPSGN